MKRLIVIIFLIFIGSRGVFAQSLTDLQVNVKQLQAEIELIDKQLIENKALQKDKSAAISLLDKKIAARRKIIEDMDAQASRLRIEMGSEGRQLASYNARLKELRGAVAMVLRESYKHSFVSRSFPAASINESQRGEVVKRQLGYLSAQIAGQLRSIDSMGRVLGVRLNEIKAQGERLELLQSEKSQELALLNSEKSEVASLQRKLKSEAGSLEGQATAKRRRVDELQRQIAAAIESEAKKQASSTTGVDMALAKQFAQNKGRLPCPVSPAKVTDSYGVHDHPWQKGVKVNNKGVNLSTGSGSSVRAVFKGEVRAVFVVEGLGSSVLVRHGDYLTVYSNLGKVNVRQGQEVDTGVVLGWLESDELHFEVWQETTNLNPQLWIKL